MSREHPNTLTGIRSGGRTVASYCVLRLSTLGVATLALLVSLGAMSAEVTKGTEVNGTELTTSELTETGLTKIDPLDSPSWNEMHRYILEGQPFVFDDRIKVTAPLSAENAMNVPVKVDASAIDGVQRVVVFADLNPITRILELEPHDVAPAVSFNFKVQQGTPLRAAALDREGVWHVGGVYLDAAGGGCTQPSVGSGNSNWADQLGNVTARLWTTEGGQRLRLRVMHPMDTGLAPKIPVFIIERLDVIDEWGEVLAHLELHEPVAENPILTLDLHKQGEVDVFASDNNGNLFAAEVTRVR